MTDVYMIGEHSRVESEEGFVVTIVKVGVTVEAVMSHVSLMSLLPR